MELRQNTESTAASKRESLPGQFRQSRRHKYFPEYYPKIRLMARYYLYWLLLKFLGFAIILRICLAFFSAAEVACPSTLSRSIQDTDKHVVRDV